MDRGDKIRIQLGQPDGDNWADGTVTHVIDADHFKATIDDPEHPLCMVDDKPRVITCGPGMWEKK